jgi:hypothetical protein
MPLYAGGRWPPRIDQARGGVDAPNWGWPMPPPHHVGAVAAYAEVLTARDRGAFRQMAGELAEVERQARLRFKAAKSPPPIWPAPPPPGRGRSRPRQAQGRRDHRRGQLRAAHRP